MTVIWNVEGAVDVHHDSTNSTDLGTACPVKSLRINAPSTP
jgi:hypothetical protein